MPQAHALGLALLLTATFAGVLLLAGAPSAAWTLVSGAVLGAAGVCLLLVVVVPRIRARALPGGRRAHGQPIPQIGGWMMGPLALLGLALTLPGHGPAIAAGAALVWGVGVLDDLFGVRARTKLGAQAVGALVVVLSGLDVHQIGAPGLGVGVIDLGGWGSLLLFVWIVGVTNAFNLVDGLDGLLGMLTLVALLGLALGGAPLLPLAAVAGPVIGVLAFNLPRARVFFGDSGSMVLGFVVGALVVELPPAQNAPLVLGLMAVPLLDLGLALARRWVRGIPLSAADLGHLHHRMFELTGGRRGLALALLTVLATIPLALSQWRPGLASLTATLVLGLVVVLGVMRLGRARLSRAIHGRARWQRLYLLEGYVAGLLRLARSVEDVRRAVQRLVDDLPLAGLSFSRATFGRPLGPQDASRDIPLEDGTEARWWCQDATPPPESLALARETVVCELVRLAARRLRDLDADASRSGSAPKPTSAPHPPASAVVARRQGA
ncbi:MAG: MraY family glycosyltransferase [Planctomycetota bacterium]